MRSNLFLILLFFTLTASSAGTYLKPPALIEGFTTTASAAGTTTLTRASETKQIITGATTQTVVMPDATTMSTELGRRFYIINKSSGNVTVNASGGGLLVTLAGGTQAEIHLRAAGSAAGTWDVLESSSGGGGAWGTITGTLSDQTDLQTALNLKAPLASPTFTGTITTPLTASRALVTGASSELAASAVTATQLGYLGTTTSDVQTQLDAKQARSTLTTKGDLYVATASATTTRLAAGSTDGRQLVTDSSGTNGLRYKAPLVDNFIKNGDAESANIFTVYNDSSTTRPVDGTASTNANVDPYISSTAPLADTYSFRIGKTGTTSTQGSGVSVPFTIPSSQKAKILQIEFNYLVTGGTFVAGSTTAESDMIVYVYDVTNSTLIEPSTIKFFSNSSTISDKFIANFQTSATGTSYRLIFHYQSTSALNYEIQIDDLQVKPCNYVYGTPITDWVAYTPTITGLGTPSAQTFYTRRVGDTRQVKFILTAGTTAASIVSFTLPNSETIDSNKIGGSTVVGKYNANTTTWNGAIFKGASNSLVYFGADGTNYTAGYSGNNFVNGTTFGGYFEVPISGWSSSVQVSDGYDGRIIAAKYTGVTTGSIGAAFNTTTYPTKVFDTTNSYSGGTYTVPSAGIYRISATNDITGTEALNSETTFAVYVNGSLSGHLGSTRSPGTVGSTTVSGSAAFNLNAGDLVTIRLYTDIGSPAYGSSSVTPSLSIEKLQVPTTMSATEEVIMTATKNGTQAIVTSAKITSLTTTKDTHGMWDSSNNRVNIFYPGSYVISQQHAFSGNASSGICAFKINGGTTYYMGTAASTDRLGGSTLIPVKLVAGDYIEFYANPNNSVTLQAGTTDTWFGVHKVK